LKHHQSGRRASRRGGASPRFVPSSSFFWSAAIAGSWRSSTLCPCTSTAVSCTCRTKFRRWTMHSNRSMNILNARLSALYGRRSQQAFGLKD
jgi:hypothetical protein